jgi:hypothetical protein
MSAASASWILNADTDSHAPLVRQMPDEISTSASQSTTLGHSPRIGIARTADNTGTTAPNTAPAETPSMATERP